MPRRRDDYDDFDADLAQPGRGVQERPTSMGMIGFIMSIVSLGLFFVVIILYIALSHEEQVQEIHQRKRLLFYWFAILDVTSFFAAMMAIILTARGLVPSNPLYRGWAIAGLVIAILEIIVTILFGMFMGLAILCVEVAGGP